MDTEGYAIHLYIRLKGFGGLEGLGLGVEGFLLSALLLLKFGLVLLVWGLWFCGALLSMVC